MLHAEAKRWTVPADLDEVAPLVLSTASFLEQQGVAARPLFKAQLLLEEIVSNVVRHGHRGDRGHDVHVHVELDGAGIWLVVEDDAGPFDPVGDAPPADVSSPLAERHGGGLGLHLVREMADELVYEREGDANRVRMRVSLAG